MGETIPLYQKNALEDISERIITVMTDEFEVSETEKYIVKTTVECMFVPMGR